MSQQTLSGNKASNSPHSSVAGFHVNSSLHPDSKKAKMMPAISCPKCLELCGNSGPLGCLERTLLGSLEWNSIISLIRWKIRNTPQGHSIFQLEPLKPSMKDNVCSSLPTITNADTMLGNLEGKEYCGNHHALKLDQVIQSVPTILKADAHGHGYQYEGKKRKKGILCQAVSKNSRQ